MNDAPSKDDVWSVGDQGLVIRTKDGAKTWTTVKSGAAGALRAVWGSGVEDLYAVGDGGRIAHSIDAGKTWKDEKSALEFISIIDKKEDPAALSLAAMF